MISGKITFVTGGSRSGKSRFAEKLAAQSTGDVVYLATCRTENGLDAEMQQRVLKHQDQRPSDWFTYENQFDLKTIANESAGKTVLLDCLTLWISDAMMQNHRDDKILSLLEAGLEEMLKHEVNLVIVSNELGCGIVPLGSDIRRYRDLVGNANQRVASLAHDAYWVVSGIPVQIKNKGSICGLNTVEF